MRRRRRDEWAAEAVPLWEEWRQDPLFLFGVALYWGEGAKVCRNGHYFLRDLVLSNSDPRLLRVWLRWCGRFLPGVPLHCDLSLHEGGDVQAARAFWERELGISVRGVSVATSRASQGKRNTLPYGTLKIRAGAGSCEWHTKMLVWFELAQGL
jgi:hypothetical protein